MWEEGKILLVEGTVKSRDDRINITCYKVRQYQTDGESEQENKPATSPTQPRKIAINMTQSEEGEEDMTRLNNIMKILTRYPGQDTVLINIVTTEETVNLKIPNTVNYCPEFAEEIEGILGKNSLSLRENHQPT